MRVDDRTDAKLDYALEMTFPASDAFTVSLPEAAGTPRPGDLIDEAGDLEGLFVVEGREG